MRVLLTGAAGQLGREVREAAPEGIALAAFDRAGLDLTSGERMARVVAEVGPELIINAAAYTAVDRAESEPRQAFAVNDHGAGDLARAACRAGARLVHVSTDFVFDGASGTPYGPLDEPRPLGVYGASKLAGERRVLEVTGGEALVLRTAWLYSRFGDNFVTRMLALMRTREGLEVVSDQVGSPTWAGGLARAIWKTAASPAMKGVHHWTDAGVASRYDLALAVRDEALALGLLTRQVPVAPVATSRFPTPARRPAFSVLEQSATRRQLGLAPMHWRAALRRMLEELAEERDG